MKIIDRDSEPLDNFKLVEKEKKTTIKLINKDNGEEFTDKKKNDQENLVTNPQPPQKETQK